MKNTIKFLTVLFTAVLSVLVYAAPQFEEVNISRSQVNVNNISITTPLTGASNGDLLLAVIGVHDDDALPFTDPVAGWILIDEVENNNGNNNQNASLAVYYRIVDGSESASYSFSWSDADQVVAAILRYSGVDTTNPIDAFSFVEINPNAITPSVTSTVNDATVVRIAVVDTDEDAAMAGLATSRVAEASEDANDNTADRVSLGVADSVQVTAGATGTAEFPLASNERTAVATIVLSPLVDFVEIGMVSKTVSDPFPNEGDTITYTLDLINNGTLASTADISDVMPGLDSPVTVSGTAGGSCTGSLVTPVSCTTASIAAGGSATVIITGTVSSSLTDETATTNTASLTAVDDTDTSNDSASADIVTCAAGLLNNGVTVGSTYTYFSDPDLTNNTDNECTEVGGLDYGDAPTATYGSPSHGIDPDLYIGSVAPDADDNNQGSVNADGDDADIDGDDEDGVTFTSPGGGDHAEIYATVSITNNTGSSATVCAWLDEWDAAGNPSDTFTGADTSTCQTGTGSSFEFYWGDLEQASGFSYARFRVCSTATECDDPTEVASNGEVEDYRLNFDFTPTAVTIGSVNIESVSVGGFLTGIGAGQMTDDQLLALLTAWDPGAVDSVATNDVLDALYGYLDPDGDGQVALLIWDTLEERGTIGFFVERKTTDGSWTRINDEMLPGLITAPMGGEYRLVDPGAQSGSTYEYQLIEQEATGRTNTYGPFEIEMQ